MNGLVFIRHAETDMAGTFCGHSDPPINARGIAQLAALRMTLASERFGAIYSSDLRRAVETATPIATTFAIPIITTPLLREIDFGKWEGLTWAQIEQQDAAYARRWIAEFPSLPASGGETFASLQHRVLQQVDELQSLAKEKRIAIMTHAGVMRVVLCNIMGHTDQEAWALTQSYCCSFVCSKGASQ